MMSGERWGRWQLDGIHLVYRPEEGSVDPGYEIDTSRLNGTARIEEYVEHLREKSWIRPGDLSNLSEACELIMRARLLDEHRLAVPQAMGWDEYRSTLINEWTNFLNSADPRDEAAFQAFLEQHPSLLPGPYGTVHGRYHGPMLGVVYAQPELPGFRAKRPDFLLFEQDSATVYAILIEIEAPSKPWCTNQGTPSALFTKAIDQLRDWKSWFSKPTNVLAFQDLYGLREETRRFVQHYVLVYGRRDEANRLASFATKRHDLAGSEEFLMTYDRLNPTGSADLTVKLDRSGPDTKLRVVSIPPTFTLNQRNAKWFTSLLGIEEAIQKIPFVSEARKSFLLERARIAESYVQRRGRHTENLWSTWA